MNKEDRNSFRKEMLGKLEEQWAKSNSPEDDLFYYHPSEDKIVLSHALFWVMTQNIKGKVGKEKYFLLLCCLGRRNKINYCFRKDNKVSLLRGAGRKMGM